MSPAGQTDHLDRRLERIESAIDGLPARLDSIYVRKEAFEPVRMLVFGLAALALLTVFGTLLTMAVRGGDPMASKIPQAQIQATE